MKTAQLIDEAIQILKGDVTPQLAERALRKLMEAKAQMGQDAVHLAGSADAARVNGAISEGQITKLIDQNEPGGTSGPYVDPADVRQAMREMACDLIALLAQTADKDAERVSVDAEALHQILTALNSVHGHLIRELQATRDKPPFLTGNPIDKLIAEYNAAIAQQADQSGKEA